MGSDKLALLLQPRGKGYSRKAPEKGFSHQTKIFWPSQKRSLTKTALALHHDQGLIPVKLLAFDAAVNTTLELPFLRTSPDHGTAFDIAAQGIASPESTTAAIQAAWDLS